MQFPHDIIPVTVTFLLVLFSELLPDYCHEIHCSEFDLIGQVTERGCFVYISVHTVSLTEQSVACVK